MANQAPGTHMTQREMRAMMASEPSIVRKSRMICMRGADEQKWCEREGALEQGGGRVSVCLVDEGVEERRGESGLNKRDRRDSNGGDRKRPTAY